MRLEHIDNYWWMKPTTDEEGNEIEEFFWCVDTEFYTREDYTLVTDEYKEAYEREHYPEEEEPIDEPSEEVLE
jgi:hypothetical protein